MSILREKARKNIKRIVLPEGDEPRIIGAAAEIQKQGFAEIILLGDRENILKAAASASLSLKGVEIIEPGKYNGVDEMTRAFYELRKHKGVTESMARRQILKDTLYFGAMMTRVGAADGFVAGACHTTSNVARAAIHCLEIDEEIGVVSSSFVVEIDGCPYGEEGLFIFGDCGIVPDPTPEQLAGIALSSGDLIKCLFDIEPKAALLSYATKGSAKGSSVDKVRQALAIIKSKRPGFKVDGELQVDAAIVPEVARIKSPESPVAGKANVLVFPNLDAGNISYKLIQRLGKARVAGPILEGVTSPASDLSRGCEIEEVIDAIAVTAVRAQKIK